MKALAFFVCLFLATVAADDELSKTIYFMEIKSDNDASKLNFPNLRELFLMKPNVNNLTAAMLYQLESAKDVSFIWGTVNVAAMTPQFKHFRITKCKLTSLAIDPSLEYQVDTLLLDTNNLTALPDNFNVFRKLQLFSIEHNQIETINAEVFNEMTNLRKMSLAYNRIATISSTPARPTVLPVLKDLYLSSNQLRNVSFSNWSAPKLFTLELTDNQLSIAQSVFEAFPKVQVLSVRRNPLNCDWLKLLKKEAKVKDFYLLQNPSCKETGETMEELIERIKRE